MATPPDTDAFEAGLRRKFARKELIAGAVLAVLLLPLVGWKVFRAGTTLQKTTSRPPIAAGAIVIPDRHHLVRLGPDGQALLKEVDLLNSLAAAYGVDRVPSESWNRVRSAAERAREAAQRTPEFTDAERSTLEQLARQVEALSARVAR